MHLPEVRPSSGDALHEVRRGDRLRELLGVRQPLPGGVLERRCLLLPDPGGREDGGQGACGQVLLRLAAGDHRLGIRSRRPLPHAPAGRHDLLEGLPSETFHPLGPSVPTDREAPSCHWCMGRQSGHSSNKGTLGPTGHGGWPGGGLNLPGFPGPIRTDGPAAPSRVPPWSVTYAAGTPPISRRSPKSLPDLSQLLALKRDDPGRLLSEISCGSSRIPGLRASLDVPGAGKQRRQRYVLRRRDPPLRPVMIVERLHMLPYTRGLVPSPCRVRRADTSVSETALWSDADQDRTSMSYIPPPLPRYPPALHLFN